MTASITHCWARTIERAILLVAGLLAFAVAQAGSIEPKSASVAQEGTGLVVSADFAIRLAPRLEEAIERGVPLHFRFEFELTRKRAFWIDEHVAGRVLTTRLSHHALTRQYRLTQGSQQTNFDTLDEALQSLGHIARLAVPLSSGLHPGDTYRAAVRLALDLEQLPKPMQVDALADKDWRMTAKTQAWNFVPTADKP